MSRARQLAPQALATIERRDPQRESTPLSEARRRYRGFLRIAAGLDEPGRQTRCADRLTATDMSGTQSTQCLTPRAHFD